MKLSQIISNIKEFNKRHKINISWLWLWIIIVFSIFIGINSFYFINNSTLNTTSEIHEANNNYKYISPLLECNTTSNIESQENIDLKNLINSIITYETDNNNITDAAVYIRDLNNGPWIGINLTEKFSPASLLKVPILITYLKLAENNPKLLQEKIRTENIDPDTLDQNISPEKKIINGQEYTTLDLLTRMITYSDNSAANALVGSVNDTILNQIYSDFNINTPTSGQLENFMTVLDYSSFFRILYNSSYLNHDMSELALKILTKSTFKNGIASGLPKDIVSAHKFGERIINGESQLHDCGIVYIPGKNYLICIMTRGDDFSKMEQTIQKISAETYKAYK